MSKLLEDLTPRLEAARSSVKDAEVELELAREARNELIVQAVDEGMTQKTVAELAGVSQPHVIRVLAGSEPAAVVPRS